MDARGTFGEHEGSVREKSDSSSLLSSISGETLLKLGYGNLSLSDLYTSSYGRTAVRMLLTNVP